MRVLNRGTRIILKTADVKQSNLLVISELRDASEKWKGREYVCFPDGGGFGRLITEAAMFEQFRQVHPSELARVPWEKAKFSTEDPDASTPKMYEGLWRGRSWNGWACPWFTHETMLELRRDWHKSNAEYIEKYGSESQDDLMFWIYDDYLGWCFRNGNLEDFVILPKTAAVIGDEIGVVYDASCGLTWTDWTDQDIERLKESIEEEAN